MRPHIVLVTREVWPFVLGGGIGRAIRDVALVLAEIADVTVLTGARHEPEHDRILSAGEHAWFDAPGIEFAWIPEPDGDLSPFWSYDQAWSANCHIALRDLAAHRQIDLIEFPDYLGSAAVTLNARRAGDELLTTVPVVVRLHTTWEMTQALDDKAADDLGSRTIVALERIGLRFADRLCSPGPETSAAFERAYGEAQLAPMITTPMPFVPPAADARALPEDGPLRLLYVGRMERRKGIDRLARAFVAQTRPDLTLTLIGGDTETGPGGGSMRAYIERLTAGDERVRVLDFVAPEEIPAIIGRHHVVVVPSLFESYGYVVREANAENRPVLGTPVGGLADGISDGENGWLTGGTSEAAIGIALASLAERRTDIESLIESGAPRRCAESVGDSTALIEAYREILDARPPQSRATVDPAPVSVIVTAVDGDGALDETLDSIAGQELQCGAVIIATDDAMRVAPAQLESITRLALISPGESAETRARRAALAVADRSHAIAFMRAGDVLAPGFLRRCAQSLASPSEPAYVTTYARGRLAGRAPLGNLAGAIVPENDAAGRVALFRPGAIVAIPDPALPGSADAALFAELAESGDFGAVIPEPLVWRVQRGSRRPAGPPQAVGLASGPSVWERQDA